MTSVEKNIFIFGERRIDIALSFYGLSKNAKHIAVDFITDIVPAGFTYSSAVVTPKILIKYIFTYLEVVLVFSDSSCPMRTL